MGYHGSSPTRAMRRGLIPPFPIEGLAAPVEGFFEQSRVHDRVQDVRQNIPWMELGNFMSESTKRRRVLVIDDEPLIGLSVEMMLSDNGFDCVGVIGSLDEALVFVNTETCDAAILDLNLTGARPYDCWA
jgi:PleD family two-component response regulator